MESEYEIANPDVPIYTKSTPNIRLIVKHGIKSVVGIRPIRILAPLTLFVCVCHHDPLEPDSIDQLEDLELLQACFQ